MPRMNGISFLKILRASGNTTPFIIFTGKGREEVVIEALNSGADFYIQKGGQPKSQFAELSNKVRYAVSRKLTENLLKESEERYRNVVEIQTEFICRFLPDGTHIFVNEAYCRYFGLERNEMIGSKFRPQMPNEDSQKISRLITSLTPNNPYTIIEHRIFMSDGSTRWQRWVDRAIFNLDGSLKEYQSVGRDITELKERELALNEKNYQLQTAYEKLASNEEQLRKQIEENKIVTETLTDTKARYYEFFKTARDSVFITSPDGQWIDFNDATLELFRYESREELFNVSVLSIYAHPEDRSSFLKRVELEGYVKEFPLQLKKYDGKTFDSLINIVPIRELNGSIKAFIGSLRDITEQKRTEATLLKSEKKYRDIINNMQDVVYRTDLEGKLIMFSPHGVKLAGYNSEEEMIGFDVALDTYQNPEKRERFLAALKEKGFVENFPLVLKARDGRIRQVTASSHFYYDDKGNVLGVEGILHDITDHKEKEQELRASKERYRDLFNDNPIVLFTLDFEGKIVSVNQALTDQLGYTAGELEGQSVLNVFYPDDQREVTEQLQICLKSPGEEFHWQFRNVRKDGTLIWVDEYARTRISSEGDLSVLVVCQDITDRKLVEEALKINQFQLSEAMNLAQMAKWQFDVDSGIFTFDDSFYSLYGTNAKFEGGYMMPADVHANNFVHPDDLHMVADEVNKAIQATDPAYESELEHRLICRDGEIRHIIVCIGITKDENGKTIKTHGVNQDITERKLAENAVHMANHKLNLLSSITRHDINNQLLIHQGY